MLLCQGKYAVHILRRFRMEECRPMATPMVTNMTKAFTSDLELDPRIYMHMVVSLMYLVNTKPYNVFF